LTGNCSADCVAAARYAGAALRDGSEDEVVQLKLRTQEALLSLLRNTTLTDEPASGDARNLAIEEASQILVQSISPNGDFFRYVYLRLRS
jgi:hypothetical protein